MADTSIAEIQKGKATLFGITNDGDDITIDALATFILKTARLTHEFDLMDEKDATNYDANAVATNGRLRCEINVTLSGATRAAAAATGAVLTPLASVVIDNFKITALNGTWQYTGNQTIDLGSGENAKMTIPLRKYSNSTQNTSMTTTVSG
jgi:hypothetical protein